MPSNRRRLPHDYPKGRPLFVTFNLHGSIPPGLYPPADKRSSGQAFVWMDRYLDTTRTGPMYLRRKRIARVVVDSLQRGVKLGHYELHAWVIMANHVHLLVMPYADPSRFLQSLKGATAREANKLLGRTGQPFWQAESYDHWVRNREEWERIRAYIVSNPVKAGLATSPEAYPWSSATRVETSLDSAGRSACATSG